jgi:excisionase family DNA binding protein
VEVVQSSEDGAHKRRWPGKGPAPETPIDRRLASMPAVAEALGVSPKTVWRLLRDGKMPCVRMGGRTMIAVSDVDAFVAAKRGPFVDVAAA